MALMALDWYPGRAWWDFFAWLEAIIFTRWPGCRAPSAMGDAGPGHLEPVWFRKTKRSLCAPTRRSLPGGRRK